MADNNKIFALRKKSRYGLFSATCNRGIGKCTVSVSIYGFGDLIEVKKGSKLITSVDTNEDDWGFEEINEGEYNINGYHLILGKCLKRWK